jgi:nitrogen fixation protein FixH
LATVRFGLVLSALTWGCGSGQETPAAPPAGDQSKASGPTMAEGAAIEFRTEPDPPRSGDNAIEVMVRQADGSPLTDAMVTVVFSMPAMPSMNMPAMRSDATLTHAEDGRYRGTGQLEMSGTWNVNVTVSRGGDELARKNLSIIAK